MSAGGGPRPLLASLLTAKNPRLGEVVSTTVAPGLRIEDRGSNLIGEEEDRNLHWLCKWGQRPQAGASRTKAAAARPHVPRRKHGQPHASAGCGLLPPTRLSL